MRSKVGAFSFLQSSRSFFESLNSQARTDSLIEVVSDLVFGFKLLNDV